MSERAQMINLGVAEIVYWEPPEPPYRRFRRERSLGDVGEKALQLGRGHTTAWVGSRWRRKIRSISTID